MKKHKNLPLLAVLCLLLCGCPKAKTPDSPSIESRPDVSFSFEVTPQKEPGNSQKDQISDFVGDPWIEVAGNNPDFPEGDKTAEAFEVYSDLDDLGRCGAAYANVCMELMPTEKREPISQVKPSGWVQNQYDFVDGENLYNRCHLIGFQLTGENANEKNLITGTRYLNIEGMLPFENMVADYIKETGNHVLYRITPVYEGVDLVAKGVQMEGWSVEDNGEGICFNVFCYNVQPGVKIDYATGNNWPAGTADQGNNSSDIREFVLNTNSKKFHTPDCSGATNISSSNKEEYRGTRAAIIKEGYQPCGICKP